MKITKSRLTFCATFLILLSAIPALAADVTGTWTAQDKGGDGSTLNITYVFKQDEAKLTGTATVTGGDDESGSLNGKIDGNKISFTVVLSSGNYIHEGTIDGDEIKVNLKSDDPEFPIHEITLKRSK